MAAIFCLFLISSSTAMYSDSLGSNFLCGFLKAYYIKKKKKNPSSVSLNTAAICSLGVLKIGSLQQPMLLIQLRITFE